MYFSASEKLLTPGLVVTFIVGVIVFFAYHLGMAHAQQNLVPSPTVSLAPASQWTRAPDGSWEQTP